MQTSLARRERHRRNHNGTRRPGSGARSSLAIILPLFLLGTFFALSLVAFVGSVEVYSAYSKDLQDPKQLLQSLNFNQQTVLYDRTGTVQLAAFGSENRQVLTFSQIPNVVLDTTTSTEDKTFWSNAGFDPAAILSALRDAISGNARGASTITQQLVRQELLPPTTSLADRKIKEIIQSVRLTQEFPGVAGKQVIITDYLNLNFYGNQSYGIAAAAEGYFGVTDLSKLTIAQAAILAGILQAPSAYDLVANAVPQADGSLVVPDSSPIVQRRNGILEDMRLDNQEGLLRGKYSDAALVAAESEPVILHPVAQTQMIAPQFDLLVRQQLANLLCGQGTDPADCQAVDTGGYKVITTLDAKMQASAEKWLKAYIFGPNQPTLADDIAYLAALGITPKTDSYDYTRIIGPSSTSSVGLRNGNIHNGALMAEDYRTGQVLAYAGSAGFYEQPVKDPAKAGQDYFDPEYDVLSSGNGRQPGSSFKPINYLIGIQDGSMTAASLFMDVATDFGGGYTPHDADGDERGPVRLREALQYSLNIPAVKAAAINGVSHVVQRAEDFGLQFPAGSNPGVSIGIGTVEVHPADLTSAYGAIADGGTLVQRNMILSVTDSKGNPVVPLQVPTVTHPSTPAATYVMTNILAGNTDPAQNNWWSQYKIMSGSTRRPATLKTGTSDQTQDLFALGYVAPPTDPNAPAIVAGVWAGNSDNAPGHSVMSLELAAPIWHAFMQDATAGTTVTDFKQPDGVTWATVDANSGMLPGPYTTQTVREVFVNGTVPTQVDNTKVPVDVDSVTNTLWTYDCPGIKVTNGYLDLSQVDSNNPTWQKYDQIWIARAETGVGKRGGPNNAATMYFYEIGFWTPFGLTWGAPFPPTTYCTSNTGTPPPSPSETPSPEATPTPVPIFYPTPPPVAPPTPSDTPSPAALPLLPLPLMLSLYRRFRGANKSRSSRRFGHN
ncbi:MAG TPA: transglycosylase domain-containing protein [Candidatus Limnocylindrales bacterium]|jgi:penicillin-binding protein 1A